jgi:hypothetical protein
MHLFVSAFEDVPDRSASNIRHDLGELQVIAFVSALCGATSCAELAAFDPAKWRGFSDFLKRQHAVPSHDAFSAVFRMIAPRALVAASGPVLADDAALLRGGNLIAIHRKALRGALDAGASASARTRPMVSSYAARLRLTLVSVPTDRGTESEAAIEALGLIALKGSGDIDDPQALQAPSHPFEQRSTGWACMDRV